MAVLNGMISPSGHLAISGEVLISTWWGDIIGI